MSCENLVARGFEAEEGKRADLITAFEAMEHFLDSVKELSALLTRSDHVLVSTVLIPTAPPSPGGWWYYGPEHGQHIGFFRPKTLAWTAQRLNCHVATDGKAYRVFEREPISSWRWKLTRRTALLGARYQGLDEAGNEVCEHIGLHAQIQVNRGKIFNNPALINAHKTKHGGRKSFGRTQRRRLWSWITRRGGE